MQGKPAILDRTPKEIDELVKQIIIKISLEFIAPNTCRNYEAWEAGVDTLNRIDRGLSK